MEYHIDEYRRIGGKNFTTLDGYKYFSCRTKTNSLYLRCSLFRNGCKGTAKLNFQSDLIHPISQHNHSIEDYCTEIHQLKKKCKTKDKN